MRLIVDITNYSSLSCIPLPITPQAITLYEQAAADGVPEASAHLQRA